jgi:Zn-dependent M28 family amino/carboxypeptidase
MKANTSFSCFIYHGFLSHAMDDGGGAMISWTVLSLLHALNIRARRTVRHVLWSCEELGVIGANQDFKEHKNEVRTMSIVMELDNGRVSST